MSDKKWEPRLPTRQRPLESAKAKEIYARQDTIAAEKGRSMEIMKAAEAEIERLRAAIKAVENERDQKSGELAQEAISADGMTAASLVNKILVQKSSESSLMQMKDSIAKLSGAAAEAKKAVSRLRAEGGQLEREIVVLHNLKRFQLAEKHFKSFVSSWESAEADHQEVCHLLGELHTDGVDIKGLMKSAGVEEQTLFGQVAQSSFMNTKHTIADFSIEWGRGGKAAVPGNVFYKGGERSRAQQGTSDFRKGNAFGGGVKFQTN
jgi:hypothetical protein